MDIYMYINITSRAHTCVRVCTYEVTMWHQWRVKWCVHTLTWEFMGFASGRKERMHNDDDVILSMASIHSCKWCLYCLWVWVSAIDEVTPHFVLRTTSVLANNSAGCCVVLMWPHQRKKKNHCLLLTRFVRFPWARRRKKNGNRYRILEC